MASPNIFFHKQTDLEMDENLFLHFLDLTIPKQFFSSPLVVQK
jgi:hypothetical protein